jgi:hypothetical protein
VQHQIFLLMLPDNPLVRRLDNRLFKILLMSRLLQVIPHRLNPRHLHSRHLLFPRQEEMVAILLAKQAPSRDVL